MQCGVSNVSKAIEDISYYNLKEKGCYYIVMLYEYLENLLSLYSDKNQTVFEIAPFSCGLVNPALLITVVSMAARALFVA